MSKLRLLPMAALTLLLCAGCGNSPEDDADANDGVDGNTTVQPADGTTPPAESNLVAKEPMEKQAALKKMPNLKQKPETPVAKPNANNPIDVWFNAVAVAKERPKMLNLQHQLNIAKQLGDGSSVPFATFQDYAKQMKIEWKPLPENEYYLYDEKAVAVEIWYEPEADVEE